MSSVLDQSPTHRVLAAINDEREAQNAKWGEQNHPDGTGPHYKAFADFQRELTDLADKTGVLTWKHILAEEFFEALAEEDEAKLRAELIQVAAVATAWVEAIDRRVKV